MLKESTLTARTTICFRVKPDDASELAKVFPAQRGEREPSTHATKELTSRTADFPPVVRDFVETYLRPIPRGGGDVVVQREPSLVERLNGDKPKKLTKPNPIASLDGLFYEVMRRSNPHLPIPLEAVQGLVNGGIGFYAATLKRRNRYLLTCGIERLPRHFIAVTPVGHRWTRRPEDAKEQLQHCIFHLRLTMAYLAEHPIGKQSTSSSTGVAHLLSQLPNRVAFVRSAEASGEVYTQTTSNHLTGAELAARVLQLRDQTRVRYCHPRAEVEHPTPEQTTREDGRLAAAPIAAHAHVPQFTRYEEVA